MTEPELLELFRRTLRASMAVPLLAGLASCSSSSAAPGPDAARPDGTATDARRGDAPGKKMPGDAGKDAAPVDAGVKRDSAKADGGIDAAKIPDAGRDTGHVDSGKDGGKRHDAGEMDSGKDAGRHDAKHADAGKDAPAGHDAGEADAGKDVESEMDAGDPCALADVCVPQLVPATCIDGGLPGDTITPAQCSEYFGPRVSCSVLPSADGGVATIEAFLQCNGRAYAGMARPVARGQRSLLGCFFAGSAGLEAASVDSFRILSGELSAHEAPRALVEAADVAARDEARHARVTRRLARRYGPVAPHRRASERPVRALAAIAEENAVEGCVRETYGALVAHHQAEVASDPEVRTAMTRIAAEETRHAALAWAVAEWADARIDEESRARIAVARAAAVRELREASARPVPAPLTDVAGLPAAEVAGRMLRCLERELWGR